VTTTDALAQPTHDPGDPPEFPSQDPPEAEQSLGSGRSLILVVDDEADVLDYLRELLVGEGFDVVPASSGAEALSLIRVHRPDLLIVDVMMPGMNGLEFCELLRTDPTLHNVPIVVYTAHEIKAHSNSGLYDAVFTKPTEPDMLLWAIRALLPLQT
jgi:CheY-like chemotaxis protein